MVEKLRSILWKYSRDIAEWEKMGIPFRSRVYVPEVHGVPFHEREDQNHVLEREYTYIDAW